MPSPLLGGGALRSKQDMIVRAGVERIMTRQHLQQEWNSLADNFSKMLEELQRSEALGITILNMNLL